jgi:hypothetical protein
LKNEAVELILENSPFNRDTECLTYAHAESYHSGRHAEVIIYDACLHSEERIGHPGMVSAEDLKGASRRATRSFNVSAYK